MIAAALGGRGASGHRGRSAFYDQQFELAMHRLLALGGVTCQSHNASVDGRRLHYLEAGSGQPLLLLHGASGGAANWYRLIAPLARHYRILAPDLPGFGFSDPIVPDRQLGRQVAGLLAEWLASIDVQQARVVGTSFGALVALRLTERFDVPRVVITNAVGLSPGLPLLLRLATLPLVSRLVVAPSRRGTRMLLRRVLTSVPLPPEHEEALADYLYWSAKRNDAAMMARAFTRFAGLRGQRDVVSADRLRALSERLMMVWGERDTFLPLASYGSVRIIPGAGHSPNWERPELLLDIIQEFLTE